MLKLLIFPAGYDQPSISPFCTKTMLLLRLSGVEHTVRSGNPQSSPTGKLPCLKHDNGVVPDSGQIQAWLKENRGVDLDAELTDAQRATAHLIRRTLEENFYWVLVYSRWIDAEGWVFQKPVLKAIVPSALGWFLPSVLRRGLRKTLRAHGIGRHGQERIYTLGAADVTAIEALIEGPFVFGETLTTADINVYAFIGGVLANPADSAIRRAAENAPKVVALCEAVKAKYDAKA